MARRFDRLTGWFEKRPVMAVFSLLILAAVASAGYAVSPPQFLPRAEAGSEFRTTYNVGYWKGRAGGVFLIGEDLFPYQCGTARVEEPYLVHVTPYSERGCGDHVEARLVRLYEADLRVPWALISEPDRAQLKSFGRDLVNHLRTTVVTAVASPVFELEYRPVLADIIGAAMKRAWYSPETQITLSRAMNSFDADLADRVTAGIVPIIIEKAETTFWKSLREYAGSLVGGGRNPSGTASTRVMVDLLGDERVHAHLVETLPALVASGEMAGFVSTLASEMGMALLDDPRLVPLTSRLLTDSRLLGPGIGPSPLGGRKLTRDLPQWLMRLRHERDHNPLVSQVIKNVVQGRRGFLVLLITPEQQERLARGDLPTGIGMRRDGR